MPITEDAAIDRLNTLCRGSALYPHYGIPGLVLPFGWTKVLRRNPPFVMHSPGHSNPNLQRAGPGWPRVYQRHPDHRGGQNSPTRGLGTIISSTSTQDYVCLPGQGKHDIIFPRWRHRPEAVSMDRIKAFPQRQMWLHWKETRFSGTMTQSTVYSS